jgi:hypothetical protein
MKAGFFALTVAAAGLAGCASDYVPPPPSSEPGPAHQREVSEGRPGLFGDLRWNIDLKQQWEAASKSEPVSETERQDFQKWRESMTPSERQEFEEWRAWQEWKRKNPK